MKNKIALTLASLLIAGMIQTPSFATEVKTEKKVVTTKSEQNNNCVKKDKNGKCPELPKGTKPKPKKKKN